MSKARRQSANDQRSNSMNPNNPAHAASATNHSNQGNPNNPAHPDAEHAATPPAHATDVPGK